MLSTKFIINGKTYFDNDKCTISYANKFKHRFFHKYKYDTINASFSYAKYI